MELLKNGHSWEQVIENQELRAEDETADAVNDDHNSEDESDDMVGALRGGLTFEEAINKDIDLISDFLAGLRYQVQFCDQMMLNTLEREGAGFLHLAWTCLWKEKRMRKGGEQQLMWDKSTAAVMFYQPRPTPVDIDT